MFYTFGYPEPDYMYVKHNADHQSDKEKSPDPAQLSPVLFYLYFQILRVETVLRNSQLYLSALLKAKETADIYQIYIFFL